MFVRTIASLPLNKVAGVGMISNQVSVLQYRQNAMVGYNIKGESQALKRSFSADSSDMIKIVKVWVPDLRQQRVAPTRIHQTVFVPLCKVGKKDPAIR